MKHTVYEHHVAGGAQGLVIDVPGSAVVSLQIRFNSGFQFADRRIYEVPHVMEHLLANTTKRHPGPNEFNIAVTKNGAYMNASTDTQTNAYIYEFADFELNRILDLVEEQMAEPLFAAGQLAAELGNVREELARITTEHGRICASQLAAVTFPQLSMNYDERIQQLGQITLAEVRNHWRCTHTAANARFFVAGSFDDQGEQVAQRLGRIFERLTTGERLDCNREPGRGVAEPVVTKRDIEQLYYRCLLYFGELTEAERRALLLLRMVLASGKGSRVYGEARARGLAYSVGCMAHAGEGNSSFGFGGYVTPANAQALFELMAREFEAVQGGSVGERELTAAQDQLVGSVQRSVQTAGDLLGWYADAYDESNEIRDFDQTLELIRHVRADEVAAVAAKAAAGAGAVSFVGPVGETAARKLAAVLKPWRNFGL